MSDVTKLDASDCKVYFDGVQTGYTLDGSVFTVEKEHVDLLADQFGDAPVGQVFKGYSSVQVELTFAEIDVANMKKIMPELTLTTSGGDTNVEGGRDSGYNMSALTTQIKLHPRSKEDADDSTDIVIYKAIGIGPLEFEQTFDGQKRLKGTWKGLVDPSRTSGDYQFRVGPSIA